MSSPERILAVTLDYTDKTLLTELQVPVPSDATILELRQAVHDACTRDPGIWPPLWQGLGFTSSLPFDPAEISFATEHNGLGAFRDPNDPFWTLLVDDEDEVHAIIGLPAAVQPDSAFETATSNHFNSPSSLNNLESPLLGAMQDKIQQSKAKREADIRKERDQKRGLTKSLDVAKSQFKAEQERAAKLEATLKAASKSREKAKLESTMESKVAKAAQDASEVKRDVQALEKKLLAKFERVADERDTAQERSEVLSKNLDTALERIETLSKDLDIAQERSEVLSKNLNTALERIETLSKDLDTALERIDTLSEDLDTTRSQLAAVLTWQEGIINKLDPQRIASLEELSGAIVNAVLHQNFRPLYAFQLRAALDHMQSILERHIRSATSQPVGHHTRYSKLWRQRLDDEAGKELPARVAHARSLLVNAPAEYQNVINSDDAMAIICQKASPIRSTGDKVAHSYGEGATDQKAIEHVLTNPAERSGMAEILASLSNVHIKRLAARV
ncbi:unnamed protein product [Cyclocybe aegerita]|uniref:Uncharacterized protein n=1 Tax=Cyclocybe aegerita TaxID=1973307 RepID=A0A8S0W4W6_CYCAE|nr:unnamed protein product [Cyclocybe aegerita]